jgi:hypothetical protein
LRETREQILEWETRWSLAAGLAALAGVFMLIAAQVVISRISGSGDAELLRSAHEHSTAVTISAVLEAIGFIFFIAPLYFLFRAALARNPQMRAQLVGLVIAAPLFFAGSAVLNSIASNEAADQFVAGETKSTLAAEAADDKATDALAEASAHDAAVAFQLGGRIGLAIALFYTCLYAMRAGLLSRFWGSLGMALSVAALLLQIQFTLIFFLYLGILLVGKLPGGRPPAWETGEAIPWPSPGEKDPR